jgi:hypothetical protein
VKRRRVPGVIDLIEVRDPAEIEALAGDRRLDRKFETPTCAVNWLLLERSLAALSFGKRRFPTMVPRDDAERALHQQQLWARLSEKANVVTSGPGELEPLATWVRGVGSDAEVGLLVQQLLGGLFMSHFAATQESWDAAQTLVAAPRSKNIPRTVWWFASGKLTRAKRLLATMVNGDLSAVNAIGIAVHNVVRSIRHLRLLYADAATRSALSAEAAAEQSLFAPVSIYRQATAAGQLGGCPFSRHALFELRIGEASQQRQGRPLVFMDDTWSRCPANLWVPAMLQGVWNRARSAAGPDSLSPTQ